MLPAACGLLRGLLLGLLLTVNADNAGEPAEIDTCIVGAGAGGLQLAQMLLNAGRDFVLLEREAHAGSFYSKFPVHRRLISLNKRNTGRDNVEFNMRHDWNSLLGSDVAPMTNRTKERWPSADTLVQYLHEFAAPIAQAGKLLHSSEVLQIERLRPAAGASVGLFELIVQQHAPTSEDPGLNGLVARRRRFVCSIVVMAHGLGVPNKPHVPGLEYTIGYEELPDKHGPVDSERHADFWEGKNVAILGLGNAALEVSDAASPHANFVHIYTRSGKAPSVSWESHYVGSIRGIRASHLDGFLLKSLDFINLPASHFIDPEGMLIMPCGEGWPTSPQQRCILRLSNKGTIVQLGQWNEVDPKHHELMQALKDDAAAHPHAVDPKMGGESSVLVAVEGASSAYTGDGRFAHTERMWLMQRSVFERLAANGTGLLMPLFTHVHMNNWHGNPARKPYDVIVRALGWKQDVSIYGESVNPAMDMAKGGGLKYAQMTPGWESVNEPNLFFAGALGHGLDWRKSSGGFIHGFRYTARALSHVIESRLYGTSWPNTVFEPEITPETIGGLTDTDGSVQAGPELYSQELGNEVVNTLAAAFTDRIAEAAGPYQMFGMLSDGMVFCREGNGSESDRLRAVMIQEIPSAMFDANWAAYPRILWAFRYAREKVTLADVAEHGTSFGPFVWAWHCGSGAAGDAVCSKTRLRNYALLDKQRDDMASMQREGQSKTPPMKSPADPFHDMTVGLGEHSIFDDKFSFGEDPHTEFNQLDDVRIFRFWMRETLSSILLNARQETNRPPSCEHLWDQSTWNTVKRSGGSRETVTGLDGESEHEKQAAKRRRSRRAAAGKARRSNDL